MQAKKKIIGLIAGEGTIVQITAARIKERGNELICISVTPQNLCKKYADKFYKKKLTDVEQMIEILKTHKVNEVILIGRLSLKSLWDKRTVEKLKKMMEKKLFFSPITFMKKLDKILREENINVISQIEYLEDFVNHSGLLTKKSPTKELLQELKGGYRLAKEAANRNIAQAITIKDGFLVAVEDISGTDELLIKTKYLVKEGFSLIKVSSDFQDMYFDVPVVGLRTVEYLIKFQAKAMVIESQRTIFLDMEKAIELANKNQLIILSLSNKDVYQ